MTKTNPTRFAPATTTRGDRFSRLVAIEPAGKKHNGVKMWLYRCDCGAEKACPERNVRIGKTRSCGCLRAEMRHGPKVDMAGKIIGRLIVVRHIGKQKRQQMWLCQCECGNERAICQSSLAAGSTLSCGCISTEIRIARNKARMTHGCSQESWWQTYNNMRTRCCNENNEAFPSYGGRGIRICDEWLNDPRQFYRDMGDRPEGRTLDRKNNELGYSPENCRWATGEEQAQNTRRNKLTATHVRRARRLFGSGMALRDIRDEVAPNAAIDTIRSAVSGETWANI